MIKQLMTVTAAAKRPASDKEESFYCHQPIGAEHELSCVLIQRKVKVLLQIEYEISVPASWTAEDVEFHRNEGSWCVANAVDELAELVESGDCLCNRAHFEFLEDSGKPFLQEGSE